MLVHIDMQVRVPTGHRLYMPEHARKLIIAGLVNTIGTYVKCIVTVVLLQQTARLVVDCV